MPDSHQYLSKEKFGELTEELHHLKTVRRKEIAEALEYAKSLGDLSENAEYQEARESQAKTEDRIIVLENLLKHAIIVEDHHGTMLALGSTAVVQKKGEKETSQYHIVGSEEADMKEGKISNESPLGAALLGKKKGDTVAVKTPRGEQVYVVVSVE